MKIIIENLRWGNIFVRMQLFILLSIMSFAANTTTNSSLIVVNDGHSDMVVDIKRSPTNRDIWISAGKDNKVIVWNTKKDTVVSAMSVKTNGTITAMSVSDDGNYVAVGDDQCNVFVFSLDKKFSYSTKIADSNSIVSLAFLNERDVLAATLTGIIDYDFVANKKTVVKSIATISVMRLSDKKDVCAVGTREGGIHLMQTKNFNEFNTIGEAHSDWVNDVIFIRSKNQVVSVGWDGKMNLWDLFLDQKIKEIETNTKKSINSLDITKDETLIAMSCSDKSVYIYKLDQSSDTEGDFYAIFQGGHDDSVKKAYFVPQTETDIVISCGVDGKINFWKLKTFKEDLIKTYRKSRKEDK